MSYKRNLYEINLSSVPQRKDWDDVEEMGIEETNVFEDLDIKKLASSDNFSEELETFSTQISAEVSALRAAFETKAKVAPGTISSESFTQLDNIISQLEEVCSNLASAISSANLDQQESDVAVQNTENKTFKK